VGVCGCMYEDGGGSNEGVCVGVCECVWVCVGVCGCMYEDGGGSNEGVCVGVCGCMWVYV